VEVDYGSEFRYRDPILSNDTLTVVISQSGETADTLLALRYCLERGALCVGITNVVGTSISRETHCGVHINAGPEVGVASTKAYTSQFIALILLALQLSEDRISIIERRKEIINGLNELPGMIKEVLALDDELQKLAKDVLVKEKKLINYGKRISKCYMFRRCFENKGSMLHAQRGDSCRRTKTWSSCVS